MHMINNLIKVILIVLGVIVLVPAFASAQVGASANTSVKANVDTSIVPTSASVNASARAKVTATSTADSTRADRAKDKAAQEIDRRVASLNSLLERVSAMNKVTDQLKANLKTNVQTEIDGFTQLKAKINADTDLSTLKTDVQSITQSYRIYMLVIPQGRITAAGDRMATIINMMASVGTKLQARINTAKGQGADTAALEASLKDLGDKLTSAQAHAQASVNAIAPLTPDQGDKTVQDKNDAAVKSAQGEIKAGTQALVAARFVFAAIISGLGKLKINANANASSTVSQ